MKYDLIIIGGGPAGIMSAISARDHHPNWRIVLIEKNSSLGRKILITGAGRCNLTNVNLSINGETHYNHPDFVKKVFAQFGYKEIAEFFDNLGLKTVEEKKNNTGKIFPLSDQASSVVGLLTDAIMNRGIELVLETVCSGIKSRGNDFIISLKSKDKNFTLEAEKVVLATGGKTYPALGSDGSGFELAQSLGHKVIPPIPSGVPLEGKNQLAQELQGLKLLVEICLPLDKRITGDLLFTKYGLSGTAVLLASSALSTELNRLDKKSVQMKINFMPGYSAEKAKIFWLARKEKYPNRLIEVDWEGLFPAKFARTFLKFVGLTGRKYDSVSINELQKVITLLLDYPWVITATRGWNEAEFTAGGIDCNEINPNTLESKKIPDLYLVGEVIDVDGEIGGYNLSWAWSSGFVAGKMA